MMVTPRIRAFRERIWLAFNPKGEACLVEDEEEARRVETAVGWRIRSYGLEAPPKREQPAEPAEEEPFL